MRKTIAVVDDDPIYKIIIEKIIIRLNLFENVLQFSDPRTALEELSIAGPTCPDIILLDINMPHIDGWEFLDLLKVKNPKLYAFSEIYMVTSSIADSDKQKATEYEIIKGFVSKPVTIDFLKKIASS